MFDSSSYSGFQSLPVIASTPHRSWKLNSDGTKGAPTAFVGENQCSTATWRPEMPLNSRCFHSKSGSFSSGKKSDQPECCRGELRDPASCGTRRWPQIFDFNDMVILPLFFWREVAFFTSQNQKINGIGWTFGDSIPKVRCLILDLRFAMYLMYLHIISSWGWIDVCGYSSLVFNGGIKLKFRFHFWLNTSYIQFPFNRIPSPKKKNTTQKRWPLHKNIKCFWEDQRETHPQREVDSFLPVGSRKFVNFDSGCIDSLNSFEDCHRPSTSTWRPSFFPISCVSKNRSRAS